MGKILLLILVFFPILASFPVYPLRRHDRRYRDLYIRVVPGLELCCALLLPAAPGAMDLPGVCGLGLHFASGSLRSLLAIVTAFLWMMTALPCKTYFHEMEHCNRFYLFWLMSLGALMGVFLADDLFTMFVFFEVMSFTSYVWVVWPETPKALRAGETYLAIAVFGGMALLAGLLLLYRTLGTLRFGELASSAAGLSAAERAAVLPAALCCLVGFGAKAGMFPLHIWLPKAHPVAPAPASALLSGILTKSGVFGILVLSCGLLRENTGWSMILLTLGTVTMVLGAVLALFSVDLKRTLACSSMSQIGFILLGAALQGLLGEENAPAAWGTVLHMLNHSLIKLVLFLAAGVVYLGTHSLVLDDIRGWGRNKPWLKVTFLIGGAALCGIPGSSGYISKTLLHESVVEWIRLLAQRGLPTGAGRAVEWLFLLSGGLTVAYMTKLYVCIFVEPRPSGRPLGVQDYMSRATQTALFCGAAIMAVLGVTPSLTMERIGVWAGTFLYAGEGAAVHYFAWSNLEGAGISILMGAAIYALVVRTLLRRQDEETIRYPDRWPEKLDLEELVYRPLLRALSFLGAICARTAASVGDWIVLAGEKILFLRAPAIFEPRQNENFGAYGKKPRRMLVTESFSFDLLLAGAGLIGMLAYLLLKR
jgi:hydrogenase-4 component B